MLEIINKLHEDGDLKKLIDCGLISTSTMLYYEIAMEFDKQKKTTNLRTTDIVSNIEIKLDISSFTVYKALRIFKLTNK